MAFHVIVIKKEATQLDSLRLQSQINVIVLIAGEDKSRLCHFMSFYVNWVLSICLIILLKGEGKSLSYYVIYVRQQ